jgi:prepilin-type N-terminal cleavage/methylation domain-containing protein
MRIHRLKERGFTLVELMIATTVFSTVLLLATTGIINIGKLYYKGISTARTQDTARLVINEVSRSVQLTKRELKSGSAGQYQAKCIGKDRYTYSINVKVAGDNHALWYDEITEGEPCVPADSFDSAANNGRELLGSNMRLIDFSINDNPADRTRVEVKVGIAYGDDELLTTYTDDGDFVGPTAADAQCKPTNSGGSFCAVSSLETFVKRRFIIVYLN